MNAGAGAISVRRANPDDAGLIHEWRNQPSTLAFQASPPRTLEQVVAVVQEHAAVAVTPDATGRITWMILLEGETAGTMTLTINGDYDRQHNNATVGYMVGEAYQNRGVATRGLAEILRIGFNPAMLGLQRIEAVAAAENHQSRRVLEKAGFTFEGIRRKMLVIAGERVDHAAYARLASDPDVETE